MPTITRNRRDPRRRPSSFERGAEVLWFLCLALSLVLLGGAPRWALGCLGLLAASACLLSLPAQRAQSSLAVVALALSLLSLLQIAPLPDSWVKCLSPVTAQVWSSALGPGEAAAPTFSLSVDRGATAAEALKWAIYAAILYLTALVRLRVGTSRTLSIIYWLLAGLALVTLLHGVFDAAAVFGIYHPSFHPAAWALSPILNPNNLSSLMNLGVFVGLGLLNEARASLEKWAFVGTLPWLIAVSILSGSRAGVLLLLFGSTLAFCLLLASSRRRRRQSGGRTIALATVLLGGGALIWLGPTSGLWETLTDDSLEKFRILTGVGRMIADFPLTGVGAGAFESIFQRYRIDGGNYVWEHPENFLAAWISEWGILAGSLAVLALLVNLRPRYLGSANHSLVPYALVGVGAVVAQNFADVGFRTPAVLIITCSVVGTLYSRPQLRSPGQPHKHWRRLFRFVPGASSVLILVALLSLWRTGWDPLDSERRSAKSLLESTNFPDQASEEHFFDDLRQSMGRHPADAYLALLGAIGAERAGNNDALQWTAEALRRDPKSSQIHLHLAQQLHRRGANNQALLELRLATEIYEPNAEIAALLALDWTQNERDLERIVPAGRAGILALIALASKLPNERLALRLHWQEEALERDPKRATIRTQIVKLLLSAMNTQVPPCKIPSQCADTIRRYLRNPSFRNVTTEAERADLVILEAQLLSIEGHKDQALQQISSNCPRHLGECLSFWLRLATSAGEDIKEPAGLLLDQACVDSVRCSAAHRAIAEAHTILGNRAQSLDHLLEAAARDPSKEAWLGVAREATALQRDKTAQMANERASRFP